MLHILVQLICMSETAPGSYVVISKCTSPIDMVTGVIYHVFSKPACLVNKSTCKLVKKVFSLQWLCGKMRVVGDIFDTIRATISTTYYIQLTVI